MYQRTCLMLLVFVFLRQMTVPAHAEDSLSVNEILDRAHERSLAIEETIKDYTCRATFMIREPQKDGTAKTLMIQEKILYHKSPDMDREVFLSITEEGKVLSPEKVAEQQKKEDKRANKDREKDEDDGTFEFGAQPPYDPDQRNNYDFELLPPDTIRGIPTYVVRAIPREESENLLNGCLYLHEELFDVIKLDVRPAKNPKFVKKMHMIIDFHDVQPDAWLPAEMKIDAQGGFLFFKKNFQIHQTWYDYELNVGLSDSLFLPSE